MLAAMSQCHGEVLKVHLDDTRRHLQRRNIDDWLVVSTPLKNISQVGNLPQVGVIIKNL